MWSTTIPTPAHTGDSCIPGQEAFFSYTRPPRPKRVVATPAAKRKKTPLAPFLGLFFPARFGRCCVVLHLRPA